jgi:hypothetical protein
MDEERKLDKYVAVVSLVYCPKTKRIVDTMHQCTECRFYRGQGWLTLSCAYKGE